MSGASAHDRARNPHRAGTAWTLRTVAAALANPRYTGRQVWNRQSIDHHETRPGDKGSRPPGSKPTRTWNPRNQWEISPLDAHPALVSEADFLHVQRITALATPDDGNLDRYRLTGPLICGLCGRRMEGHWAHGRARYRCRHGHASASDADPDRFKTLYVRQDQLIDQARTQLAYLIGTDPDAIDAIDLAGQLRGRGFAIACTPVSITLDTGLDDAETEPEEAASADQGETSHLAMPGLTTLVLPQARRPTEAVHKT
ncbi:recombinase family protein [Krasilnikovia sp. M28-CT-15]|uniref:recombinase family protein n=1 Tax=Krasilnikovia sp. M28-CT-15 TaxID=3373540 RepID=UPI003876E710